MICETQLLEVERREALASKLQSVQRKAFYLLHEVSPASVGISAIQEELGYSNKEAARSVVEDLRKNLPENVEIINYVLDSPKMDWKFRAYLKQWKHHAVKDLNVAGFTDFSIQPTKVFLGYKLEVPGANWR